MEYLCTFASKKKESDKDSLISWIYDFSNRYYPIFEILPIWQKCPSNIGKTTSPLASVPYQSER